MPGILQFFSSAAESSGAILIAVMDSKDNPQTKLAAACRGAIVCFVDKQVKLKSADFFLPDLIFFG